MNERMPWANAPANRKRTGSATRFACGGRRLNSSSSPALPTSYGSAESLYWDDSVFVSKPKTGGDSGSFYAIWKLTSTMP